ncbi:SNF2 DNA repair protein, putative [Trypanosoma equiperdum]|uniref:SNF2 DNA repair protein, putative n=2 Tax=Trypanozoon TaxID=39700 RepID=Q384V0_TRYB2|nr:SNF2 DNA repair protein, putative [Trypanosoma brucei brucei TREU927]EAN79681.1 SNF2 DNA repair protein, putative [Trypanosoma brucei brucei TREU927]SCU70821.1 SNF2 DNA repair protein, putative [Trypanosoma equiperdum]
MEQLLRRGQEYCFDCCSQRLFRISRFGCVFECRCPDGILNVQSVLRDYVAELNEGERFIEFVPVISGRISTHNCKIAQVEIDFTNRCVRLGFMNMTTSASLQIMKELPLSLSESTMIQEGCFRYSIDSLDLLLHELRMLSGESGNRLHVNEPSRVCREAISTVKENKAVHLPDLLPPKLMAALHRHQVDGICKALSFGGRAMFADEMGVGKTLQAIGTLAALNAFPALIVCPAALRHMWADELEKWLMDVLNMDDIRVITSSSDFLSRSDEPKVVVTSFHMVSLLANHMKSRQWSSLVVDESHILHTSVDASCDAHYTTLLCELGRRTKYCLLLTGTPSLSTPFDLFNQVDTVCPGLLGSSRFEFALRYCRIEFSPYFRTFECTRSTELHSLLNATCMIRRLKSETLVDLPTKQRVILRIPTDAIRGQKNKSLFQKVYSDNWIESREKILDIVDLLLCKHGKIVLFAHHLNLLDCLTTYVNDKKVTWIRIDGGTPMNSRVELLSRFNDGDVSVALVGITACAVGVRLTGASCALFAELPPDIGWMQQAEDRLHRPGQKNHVILYYIISTGSFFDGAQFSRLSRSFQAVRRITDGVKLSLDASYLSGTAPVHNALLEEEATPSAGHPAPSFLDISGLSAPLLFRISHNTGRIHVVHEGKHLTSLSTQEAQQYWRHDGEFPRQLRDYLSHVDMLSPVERRRLRTAAAWLPSNFTWRPVRAPRKTVVRYAKSDILLGRVFFWKVVKRNFPERTYGALLVPLETHFLPVCLECDSTLVASEFISPGSVVRIDDDTRMFCSGACRGVFFIKRSSSAARRGVQEVDKGICSVCQVDCELLYSLAVAATSRSEREDILDRLHPQLRQHPVLFNRIVEHPTPGSIWNADHILAVSQGGGSSDLDNLQTLCVACHADKTVSEARVGYKAVAEKVPRTTVNLASLHFLSRGVRRVTSACPTV